MPMTPDPSPAEDTPQPDSGRAGARPRATGRLRESPMDLPGIEGYTIDGVLGHGATGTVVSGVQIAVDRPVAIKFLHPELCSDKRAIIRLQREARAAARLAHPGIISAVDMGVSEGRWWYAMELVEGISLAERIEERGTLTEREAIRLFAPIVDALEHAHGMGVIHRDVKPANILIDGRGRARLVDLGLAWAETDPRVTSGGTLGTPHYISPEQARNPSDVDGRSDIWSLGATLFHALTGRPPFVGDSVAEVLSGVLYQPMPDPRGLVPGLSKGISLVLRKCLSRDPNLRYRAPLELLKDLERLRERRAPKVRPEELEPLTHGPGRTLRLVGVGVLGLVAAGGWVAWWQPWSTDQPERIRSMDVSEWPALDEVRRGLEGGTVSLRRSEESLALLVSPAVGGAPPVELRGDLARLRLSWDSQLDGALSALLTEVGVYLDRSLSNGSLAEAALYLNQELPRRVMRATGYSTIEECPDSFSGKQHALARWQGLVASVSRARAAGIASIEQDLERHRRTVLAPKVEGLVAVARYQDALDVLENPVLDWLSTSRATAMRMVDEDLQSALASASLRSALYSDRDGVRNSWRLADGELVAFLIQQAPVYQGQAGGGAALGLAWEAELVRRGVTADQLPLDADWRSAKTYAGLLQGILEQEASLMLAQTQDFFRKAVERSALLVQQRDFGTARDLWAKVLEGPASAADLEVADLRRGEMDLMVRSMELIAKVVRGRREMTLEVKGIPRSGTCRGNEAPMTRPFRLFDRVTGVVHSFALTGSVQAENKAASGGAVLMSSGDMERLLLEGLALAGGQDLIEASRASLALSLLRFHLGDPSLEPVSSGAPAPAGADGALWKDLENRVAALLDARQRQVGARRAQLEQDLTRLRTRFTAGSASDLALLAARDEFLAQYGDLLSPAQETELQELSSSLTRPPAFMSPEELFPGAEVLRDRRGALERVRFDFAQGEAMGWQAGRWSTDGDGLVLRTGTPGDQAFLRSSDAARVDLSAALNVEERLIVRFHMESLDGGGLGNEICFSLAGMHVFFVDRKSNPFMAYAGGDLEEALTRMRAGKLRSLAKFEGFPGTQPITVEISLQPRTMVLEEVKVGGQRLSLGGVRRIPGREERGLLAIRSRAPMRVLWVEIEARERD